MIKLTGLSKAYHGNQVLNGIDLEVKKGEIVVIIGPSGTGKSTLLRCLNLLETPDAGTLAIDDLELNLAKASEQQAIELRKRASFVFQNYALFANKTALDNIAEGLITVWKQPKAEARATALGILKDIGLADKQDAYPASLSGGQQQRVGIGRAMAAHSKVILFDEPTSALDTDNRAAFIKLLFEECDKQGSTLIFVSHDPYLEPLFPRVENLQQLNRRATC